MFSISRRFTFEAGHRLPSHEGKCQSYHGHSYKVSYTIRQSRAEYGADELASNGMVLDFSELKKIETDILAALDHAMLLQDSDPLGAFMAKMSRQKVAYFKDEPTAEVIATHIALLITNGLSGHTRLSVDTVSVWETETSCASFTMPR